MAPFDYRIRILTRHSSSIGTMAQSYIVSHRDIGRKYRVRVGRERTGTPFPFFLYNGNVVPVVFLLYTPNVNLLTVIFHGSPSVIKLICLICVFMCMISWMIGPPCEISDQLAVGTQNCFSTLFYTPYTNIKTSSHAPKCTIARHKNTNIFGGGARPSSHNPPPLGRGYPLPRPHPWAPSAPRFSRLRRSAFPFLFIYDSNTAKILILYITTPWEKRSRPFFALFFHNRGRCLAIRWSRPK